MAFADAIFDGTATLDGLVARRVETATELRDVLGAREALPVTIWSFSEVLRAVAWSAVIDARMRKRAVPEGQRGIAPLTIGLGPNFIAGANVDLAIETSWGDNLGVVIEAGSTLPLAGEPRPIGRSRAWSILIPRRLSPAKSRPVRSADEKSARWPSLILRL